MAKKKFRFGDEYLDAYGRAVFRVRRYRSKAPTLRLNSRKHRDAQQYAYVLKAD